MSLAGYEALPKLIAFDLDYTLWPLWVDFHVCTPLHRQGSSLNHVSDIYGASISMYPEVPQILHRLRSAGVVIAACSRTSAPDLVKEALSLLLFPSKDGDKDTPHVRAIDLFDQLEIYPGSKISHFQQLHQKTGISYSEMLFFDDERRNKDVERLGVTFYLVTQGMENQILEKGIAEWRRRCGVEDLCN